MAKIGLSLRISFLGNNLAPIYLYGHRRNFPLDSICIFQDKSLGAEPFSNFRSGNGRARSGNYYLYY